MLPQMMPLPWVMVFLMIFFSFFSVSLFLNYFFMTKQEDLGVKVVNKFFVNMPW